MAVNVAQIKDLLRPGLRKINGAYDKSQTVNTQSTLTMPVVDYSSNTVRLSPEQIGIAQRLFPDLERQEAMLAYARALVKARENVAFPLVYAVARIDPPPPTPDEAPPESRTRGALDLSVDPVEIASVRPPIRDLDL